MPGGIYDSPTFLSQKDTYMAGMTLPQLMACMVMAVFVFLISLALPFGFMFRMIFVIPGTGLCAFLCFGRIYGLSVPGFLLTALLFPFRSPVYEDERDAVLRGDPVWLGRRGVAASGGSRGIRSLRSKAAAASASMDSLEGQAIRAEIKSESSAKVDEGARSLERFVRDGIRSIFRSG